MVRVPTCVPMHLGHVNVIKTIGSQMMGVANVKTLSLAAKSVIKLARTRSFPCTIMLQYLGMAPVGSII